jgi:hypothetical protein
MSEKGGAGDSQLADDENETTETEVESWMRKVARSPDAVAPAPPLEPGQIVGGK